MSRLGRVRGWAGGTVGRYVLAAVAVVVISGSGLAFTFGGASQAGAASDDGSGVRADDFRIPGVRESDGAPVNLDVTVFSPASGKPAPAVLLAHGYGGTKNSTAAQARTLARDGYVAVTWTARGFGDSGGRIHLDAPGFEVRDASLLIDWLSKRPQVRQDATGDPRVAVVGGSYGGALSLLLAGTDDRVDAVSASITWNDLRQALFPQFATASPGVTPAGVVPKAETGVFKKAWTGQLLASGLGAPASSSSAAPTGSAPTDAQASGAAGIAAACGRLDLEVCAGYAEAAQTGRPSARMLALLAASSPARVLGSIKAPTLLFQGETDSLFPISEADANAAGIAKAGTPVAVDWFGGGHDGGDAETDRLQAKILTWLAHYLKPAEVPVDGPLPVPAFSVTLPGAAVSSTGAQVEPEHRELPAGEPGLTGAAALRTGTVELTGGTQTFLSPPGAYPAAISVLPGLGSLLSTVSQAASALPGGASAGSGGLSTSQLAVLPGQSAIFPSAPLTSPLRIVGGARATLSVTSTAADATLFLSLVDQAPDGSLTLPSQLVTPVRVTGTPNRAQDVAVQLPAIVRDVPAGHRIGLVVSSTDQGYSLPVDARAYRVSIADGGALAVPAVPVEATATGGDTNLAVVALVMLALTVGGILIALGLSRRRRRADDEIPGDDGLAQVPLAITGLSKSYKGGFRAVTELSFRVEAGQVLGLLGPNGAGKTTTLRMLMGLILPTEGEIRVFGRRVRPGAPVLSRIGAFVEGPGFLPHLSGIANLQLYWAATGRPVQEAHLAEALEVAGLGEDVERTVRTYSQGMRQRLAIAQAMLGLPDLLVLDEPTNGLDPPQIREMREVLRRYAATGRTVVVSSHLLAEVEQTCTDVVVMHHGKLVAQGPVSQIVGASGQLALEVDDPERAADVAVDVPGIDDVMTTDTELLVHAPNGSADLVDALVGAGVRIERVAPRRGLEEAFLDLVGRQ